MLLKLEHLNMHSFPLHSDTVYNLLNQSLEVALLALT